MRLINADAIPWQYGSEGDIVAYPETIDEMPTIVPDRKVGKWIYHPEIKNVYGGKCIECSECGEKYMVVYIEDEKYCRNCGSYNGAKTEARG